MKKSILNIGKIILITLSIAISMLYIYGCSNMNNAASPASEPVSFEDMQIPKDFNWRNDHQANLKITLSDPSIRKVVIVSYINLDDQSVEAFRGFTSPEGIIDYHMNLPLYVKNISLKIGSEIQAISIENGIIKN